MEQKEKKEKRKKNLPLATPFTSPISTSGSSSSGSSSVATMLTQFEQKRNIDTISSPVTVDKKEAKDTISEPDTEEKPTLAPSSSTPPVYPYVSFVSIKRDKLLEQLDQRFQPTEHKYENTSIQVIQGIGGIGKTQLASQYVECFFGKEGARKIYADSSNLETEWQFLGYRLGLDLKGLEQTEQRRLIREELQRVPTWLLILDNMENMKDLTGLLPDTLTSNQRVLITTRSKEWGQLPVLTVDGFKTDELLLAYFKQFLTPEQCKGAEKLPEGLSYLPLALSHAVAYMHQTGIGAEEYLELYQQAGKALLRDIKETTSNKYSNTILITCTLSIQALEKHNDKAAQVVKFCAYLYPEHIEARFLKALDIDESDMVVGLKYGLLTRGRGNDPRFRMHRLVQEAIRHQDAAVFDSKQLFMQRIRPLADALHKFYLSEKAWIEDYPLAHTLQRHLNVVLEQLQLLTTDKDKLDSPAEWQVTLLAHSGEFFHIVLGKATKVLECHEKSLAIALKIYDSEEHPSVAESYSCIGLAQMMLDDSDAALTNFGKSLEIHLKLYKEPHLDLAADYINLGFLHGMSGNTSLALSNYEQALKIRLKIHNGHPHLDVAFSYSEVGKMHQTLGNLELALENFKESLAIFLKIYGEEPPHPHVATSYTNVGSIHFMLMNEKLALINYKKSLTMYLKIYGEIHPDVAMSYRNIGFTYDALKNTQEALINHQKSLAIYLKIYDKNHLDVAEGYLNIGEAYDALGDSTLAAENYKRSSAIYLNIYGVNHPAVAKSFKNVGLTYVKLGDKKSALPFLQTSLEIYQKLNWLQEVEEMGGFINKLESEISIQQGSTSTTTSTLSSSGRNSGLDIKPLVSSPTESTQPNFDHKDDKKNQSFLSTSTTHTPNLFSPKANVPTETLSNLKKTLQELGENQGYRFTCVRLQSEQLQVAFTSFNTVSEFFKPIKIQKQLMGLNKSLQLYMKENGLQKNDFKFITNFKNWTLTIKAKTSLIDELNDLLQGAKLVSKAQTETGTCRLQ